MSRAAAGARRRVLFLYNVPEWAIHNVGRDWAALLEETHDVTLMQFGLHEREDPAAWDHVVLGYSTMRYSGRTLLASLSQRPFGWFRWQAGRPANLRAVVQDPSELFPEVPDWKQARARTAHLRRFAGLAVTSNEMHGVLAGLGFATTKVNTRSLLPLRDAGTVVHEGLRAFTRAQVYPRKNLALFEALRARFAATAEKFDAITGMAVREPDAYAWQIDGYNCYVCTSWQEGGPLPMMDAQRRGCVVLTTRVGQTDELVEDGVNGFFCDDEESFASALQRLRDDPERLHAMRLRTLERAADTRDEAVRAQLRAFLP